MPHLRFSRDRRGYENTYVVHTPRRRGSKGEPRILYWFRTPPGVRVGRSALDEDAIRLLEEHNPDVHFDWTRMLKQPQVTNPEGPTQRSERRRDQHRSPGRSSRPPGAPPRAAAAPPAEPRELIEPEPTQEPEVADIEPDLDALDAQESVSIAVEPIELAGLGAEQTAGEDEGEGRADGRPPSAAEARLGAEALARLRARYAELLARIDERGGDEAARGELKDRAERLNPDAWVTDEEVRNALEQYEAVFESLRSFVGQRRRRRRRGRRAQGDESPGGGRGV